jgi:hypothetical protein
MMSTGMGLAYAACNPAITPSPVSAAAAPCPYDEREAVVDGPLQRLSNLGGPWPLCSLSQGALLGLPNMVRGRRRVSSQSGGVPSSAAGEAFRTGHTMTGSTYHFGIELAGREQQTMLHDGSQRMDGL